MPEGVEPVKRLADYVKYIKTDFHYTSQILRCLQTSQIVSDITGKKFEQNEFLNEYLEDSFEQFKDRIENLVVKFEEQTSVSYLICTHGAVISALKHILIFGQYNEGDLMDFPVPGTLMIINNTGSEIINFN